MGEKVGTVAIKQSFKHKTRLKFWTTIRAPENLKHHKTRLKSAFWTTIRVEIVALPKPHSFRRG